MVIVWDNGATPTAAAQKLYQQPLWKGLPEVKAGQVVRPSMPSSYGQALAFLDLLETTCKRLQQAGK